MPSSDFHKLNKGLKLESFLIAFGESASRARKIINILIIASIAAFLGLLNSCSKKWNWFPSRQQRMSEMHQVVCFENNNDGARQNKDSIKYKTPKGDTAHRENNFTPGNYQHLLMELTSHEKDRFEIGDFSGNEPEFPWIHFKLPAFVLKNGWIDIASVVKYKTPILNGYHMACLTTISSMYELDRTIQAMTRARLENSTFVRIPILGIAFDVNWLIIASGAGFCAIYFLLYYSLSRERKNIVLLFRIASYENMPVARLYQFMSMQQVFTIPPSIDEYLDKSHKSENDQLNEKWNNRVRRFFPKIAWISPIFFWLAVLIYDIDSKRFGLVLNEQLTHMQFIAAAFIGVIMAVLVYLSVDESVKIDKEWKEKAIYVRDNESPDTESEQPGDIQKPV